jgi:hypothetical protein
MLTTFRLAVRMNSPRPDAREWRVLRLVAEAGGYHEGLSDVEADPCVRRGWLIPEGERGYGLTLDGRVAMKPLWN